MPGTPVPDGYQTVIPYLLVENVDGIIQFTEKAFGARLLERHEAADGSVAHAEVRIGDSVVMMGQAGGEWKAMPAMLCLYVEECDAVYQRALAAGGNSIREPADQKYGDRSAGVKDPGDNQWWIATRL